MTGRRRILPCQALHPSLALPHEEGGKRRPLAEMAAPR